MKQNHSHKNQHLGSPVSHYHQVTPVLKVKGCHPHQKALYHQHNPIFQTRQYPMYPNSPIHILPNMHQIIEQKNPSQTIRGTEDLIILTMAILPPVTKAMISENLFVVSLDWDDVDMDLSASFGMTIISCNDFRCSRAVAFLFFVMFMTLCFNKALQHISDLFSNLI